MVAAKAATAPAAFVCPSCSLESRLVLLVEDWDGDPSTGFATLRALVCPVTGLTGWPPHATVQTGRTDVRRRA